MKRILLIFVSILCLIAGSAAQSPALKQANDLYKKGDFESAAHQYEKVLNTEGVAPELYYNLGNSYYKSNEVGKSILNYERALRLNPYYEDARVNLEMAQLKVVDNIVQVPSFFLMRWIENLIKLLSSNQWLILSLTAFIISIVLGFFFVFGYTKSVRKTTFYFGVVVLSISVLTLVFSGIRKDEMINHREAVIMTGSVTVKSSPDRSGTDLFQLHEGTIVVVKSTLGTWAEIKLGNGNIGWVEQKELERI